MDTTLTRRRFERLVVKALKELPEEIRSLMDNVAILIQATPTPAQLAEVGLGADNTLLGLYQGVPLTDRTSGYGMTLPDRITIFQQPIEQMCVNDTEITLQVRRTVIHEIAHHFGIGDERLREMGWG